MRVGCKFLAALVTAIISEHFIHVRANDKSHHVHFPWKRPMPDFRGGEYPSPRHHAPPKEMITDEVAGLDQNDDGLEETAGPMAIPTSESIRTPATGTGPTVSSTNIQPFQYQRHMTRSEERAILGRAVLTTPHRRMPAIRIAASPRPPFTSPQNPGPIMQATPIFVTKFSLCESLGCALRDVRVIDQLCGRYSGPAFLARSNCVIVNVGHVRAIVMRNQVLIFLPEASPSSSSSGIGSISKNGNDHEDIGYDRTQKTIETIECLVEALVTHLNSIYHSSHHLEFDDEYGQHDTHMKLASKNGTPKGQQWGSGWYSSTGSNPSALENWTPSSKVGLKKKVGKKRKKNQKGKNAKSASYSEGASSAPAPPFELVVIEALLGHVCSHKATKVSKLIQSAKVILDGITHNFSERDSSHKKDAFIEMQAKLGELLPLKNKVDELEAKCAEVASAIAEVLKNDEDMAAMRLSEIDDDMILDGDPHNLHVEVELLFEDYLLQMDEVLLSLRSVQSSVTNTEEVVEIKLDLLRNRIMRYEMLLELSGLVVGVAAAVTGAFGMNLINHFEEHPSMFYQVSAALVLAMIAMAFAVLKKLSNDNIL